MKREELYNFVKKTAFAPLLNLYGFHKKLSGKNSLYLDLESCTDSPINCSHPAVIRTPDFNKNLSEGYTVVTRYLQDGTCFVRDLRGCGLRTLKQWTSTSQISKDLDLILSSTMVNPATGDARPLYRLVACGKCLLCASRKQNTYALRVCAELASYPSRPLAILLSYNDEHLPRLGVKVEDFQNFMKRLRRALDEAGIVHRLRYLACGEYGHDHKRPHYHILLMGFPFEAFLDLTTAYHFIERAWSTYKLMLNRYGVMSRYREDQDGNPEGSPEFKRAEELRIPLLHWAVEPFGFVFFKQCNSGIARYFAKYVTKSNKEVFQGHEDCDFFQRAGVKSIDMLNDPFICQSQKGGGLGTDYFRANPADPTALDYKVLDPSAKCKSVTASASLPFAVAYPTIARLLGVNVYRDFRALYAIYTYLDALGYDRQSDIKTLLRLMHIPAPSVGEIHDYISTGVSAVRFHHLTRVMYFLEDRYSDFPFALYLDAENDNYSQRVARNNFIEKNEKKIDLRQNLLQRRLRERRADARHVANYVSIVPLF